MADVLEFGKKLKHLSHDPLRCCQYLTTAVRNCTSSDYCRLEVFARSEFFSVTFEEDGGYKMRWLSPDSCASNWLRATKDCCFYVEQDTASMGQPLPDEWRADRPCASFLSCRMRTHDATQPIWGTLTLGHRDKYHFHEGSLRITLQLMDAFMKSAQTNFLTDVSQTICNLRCSASLSSFVGVLSEFYRSHAPVLSVSVAVRRGLEEQTALFTEDSTASSSGAQKPLKRTNLRMDETTLFSRIQRMGERQPLEVKIPSMKDNPQQNFELDLKKILPVQRMSSTVFWGLPLWKPPSSSVPVLGASISQSSLSTSSGEADDLMGVVYLRVRNARIFRELGVQIHSLSPIFASTLQRRLPCMEDGFDQPNIQDIPSPRRIIEHQNAEDTEMAKKIKSIIHTMNQHKKEDWQSSSNPLSSLVMKAVLSDASTCGVIVKGTYKDQPVGIKVIPGRRATERNADVSRLGLEFAISRCVSHPNVIESYKQQINLPGTQLLQCCPPCTCHEEAGGTSVCHHHQILELLGKKASPQNVESCPWDVMVMELGDAGTLFLMIHRRHAFWDSVGNGSAFNVRALLLTLLEMARALAYLHDNGIVHGDFKPENVFVVSQPTSACDARGWSVKVADFGTSRILGYKEHLCLHEGTPAYRPPELMGIHRHQKKSLADGMAADAYSFGMTLWEMMETKLPFAHIKDSVELQRKVMGGCRPEVTVSCDPDCKKLLERCWHQQPKERPLFSSIVQEVKDMLASHSS